MKNRTDRTLTGLVLLLLVPGFLQAQDLDLTVQSLKRSEVPDDFPFQILHEGFAILLVEIENLSAEDQRIDLASLMVRAPGKKKLKRAIPTEIAPKLMKYFRGSQGGGILGETHIGRRPNPIMDRSDPLPTAGGGGTSIDVSTGTRLRQVLEHFELKEGLLPAGERLFGFLYVRSKKSGTRLRGGSVELVGSSATIP